MSVSLKFNLSWTCWLIYYFKTKSVIKIIECTFKFINTKTKLNVRPNHMPPDVWMLWRYDVTAVGNCDENVKSKRKWTLWDQSKADVISGNNLEPIGRRLRGRALTNWGPRARINRGARQRGKGWGLQGQTPGRARDNRLEGWQSFWLNAEEIE